MVTISSISTCLSTSISSGVTERVTTNTTGKNISHKRIILSKPSLSGMMPTTVMAKCTTITTVPQGTMNTIMNLTMATSITARLALLDHHLVNKHSQIYLE